LVSGDSLLLKLLPELICLPGAGAEVLKGLESVVFAAWPLVTTDCGLEGELGLGEGVLFRREEMGRDRPELLTDLGMA